MFKKTNPQQHLFGEDTALSRGMRVRVKNSWAKVFRDEILPILLAAEEDFAILYGITGRPNFSVGRILGLCLLQELFAFSDQQALDSFGFDARWQYALNINVDEDAYLSRRSLVEFRRRLVEKDPETMVEGRSHLHPRPVVGLRSQSCAKYTCDKPLGTHSDRLGEI